MRILVIFFCYWVIFFLHAFKTGLFLNWIMSCKTSTISYIWDQWNSADAHYLTNVLFSLDPWVCALKFNIFLCLQIFLNRQQVQPRPLIFILYYIYTLRINIWLGRGFVIEISFAATALSKQLRMHSLSLNKCKLIKHDSDVEDNRCVHWCMQSKNIVTIHVCFSDLNLDT